MAGSSEYADLLARAIRLASEEGDTSSEEIRAVITEALSDPGLEARLLELLEAEGVTPELRREYLNIFAEWRRASTAQRRSSS